MNVIPETQVLVWQGCRGVYEQEHRGEWLHWYGQARENKRTKKQEKPNMRWINGWITSIYLCELPRRLLCRQSTHFNHRQPENGPPCHVVSFCFSMAYLVLMSLYCVHQNPHFRRTHMIVKGWLSANQNISAECDVHLHPERSDSFEVPSMAESLFPTI